MSTGSVNPQEQVNENHEVEEVEVTELVERISRLEAGQKDHSKSLGELGKRITDCEDSIDALSE